jgi:hypothetical protein
MKTVRSIVAERYRLIHMSKVDQMLYMNRYLNVKSGQKHLILIKG